MLRSHLTTLPIRKHSTEEGYLGALPFAMFILHILSPVSVSHSDLLVFICMLPGERPFRCPIPGCGRSFTTSNIRKVHVRTHTGERPYVCPEEGCDRAFASATNYKNHLRIHSGEKPYVCTVQVRAYRYSMFL